VNCSTSKPGSSASTTSPGVASGPTSPTLLQEAGDSLMMTLGEAANQLSRLGVLAPDGVEWALAVANRNFIVHQSDEINRELTWLTLSRDLPAWRSSLALLFVDASTTIQDDSD
jgi:uncharacterized protein with HEPN domain